MQITELEPRGEYAHSSFLRIVLLCIILIGEPPDPVKVVVIRGYEVHRR